MDVLLSRRRDSPLAADESRDLEAHVAGCAGCRRAAQADRMLSAALQVDPLPGASLPVGADAVSWITAWEAAPAAGFRLPRRLLGTGAALAAAAAVCLFVRPVGPQAPVPVTAPAAAEAPLPALVIVDDEETGRQVLVGPLEAASAAWEAQPTP